MLESEMICSQIQHKARFKWFQDRVEELKAEIKSLKATKDIDDVIDDFISILDFDQIIAWANLFDVEINYPPIDDMWPDWENELAVEVGEAMRKVGEK
jgi:hypothetical protein